MTTHNTPDSKGEALEVAGANGHVHKFGIVNVPPEFGHSYRRCTDCLLSVHLAGHDPIHCDLCAHSRASVAAVAGDAERWFKTLASVISTAEPTSTEQGNNSHFVISRKSLNELGGIHRELANQLYGPSALDADERAAWEKWKAPAAAASSPAPAGLPRLDCPMCNAPKSFVIDANDPALGYCHAEKTSWRITDNKCLTTGCYKPRATFGDLCMDCLAKAVDEEELTPLQQAMVEHDADMARLDRNTLAHVHCWHERVDAASFCCGCEDLPHAPAEPLQPEGEQEQR